MPECGNPVWPCAMTGAAACLSGFEGLEVIIHGPSGCFYYPATVLHRPLSCSFLTGDEIVCGAEERLQDLIRTLIGKRRKIAVITTCIPALTGEDLNDLGRQNDLIIIDSPGFLGDFETGYSLALQQLPVRIAPGSEGVNLDGISLFDPFCSGNIMEARRLLDRMGIPLATTFCDDKLQSLDTVSPFTLTTNPDYSSGTGQSLGCILGLDDVRSTCDSVAGIFPSAEVDGIYREADHAEERIIHACDRYLRRYDPPSVAIFAGDGYARFIADLLDRYLDAPILCIGSRNVPVPSRFHSIWMTSLDQIRDMIGDSKPDLIFGSSFENSIRDGAAFIPVTPPVRGTIRLRSHAICGIEGTLSCMEETLNACMDRVHKVPPL